MKSGAGRLLAGVAGLCFAAWTAAPAAPYVIDKGRSSISIAAKATGHSFGGKLKKYEISASGDMTALKPEAVELSWSFKDLDTDDSKRDAEMIKWLGGGDPKGSFKFTKVWSRNGTDYAEGTLTINGKSKTIHIPVKITNDGGTVTTTGKITIDYTDFGLPQIRAMVVMTVDPEVTVSFTLVGKAG